MSETTRAAIDHVKSMVDIPHAVRRMSRGAGWIGRRRDGRLVDLCPDCVAREAS